MEEITLNFSQEALKERKKNRNILMIMIPVLVVCYSLYFVVKADIIDENAQKLFLTIIGVGLLLIMIEMFVIFRIMFKKIGEMKLIVSDSVIKRIGGKFEETISYEDIQKVSVKRDKTNRILYIKIKNTRGNINLAGFDGMDYLFHQIRVNMLDESRIVEIKSKTNWNSPFIVVVSVLVGFFASPFLIHLDMDIIYSYLPVIVGVIGLIAKPISKNGGARFRTLEIVLSWICIVAGLLRVILQ